MNDTKRRCGEPAARGRCTFNATELKQLLGSAPVFKGGVVQSTPDRRLIERAKRGDTGAFEAVLAPVIDVAHRYACALLSDSDLAEDAVEVPR